MKTILLIILIMLSSGSCWATGYDILINENGYDLKIELEFKNYQTLTNIREALVKSEIISQLSPNVKSVTIKGSPENYESLMLVKSFGMKSDLLSKCKEETSETRWHRACTLQTDQYDGGKHMIWKTDDVVCTKKSEEYTDCLFSIKGKTKPLVILGIELLNDRVFAVKVKLEALSNFFKLFYFITDYNASIKLALEKFDNSIIKKDLAVFEKEGSAKLKKENSYRRTFTMVESK